MREDYGVMQNSLAVRMGPSASREQYEFGEEAYGLFDDRYIYQK
jgi:copper oxidase (laccase) domain-containing protein